MSNWRSELKFSERYENIEKLRKIIEAGGLSLDGEQQQSSLEIETEAYNTSESRDAYHAACNTVNFEVLDSSQCIPQRSSSPPTTIGHYEDCHHIASGLVSEVYRCKTTALKIITETRDVEPHNPAREVKILTALSHEHVIKLEETFRSRQGQLVLVFPFMSYTLTDMLSSGITQEATRSCFHDLFSALAYIHGKGIIHRDVKPSNVLLASLSGPAYLCDFGTAWHPTLSTYGEPAHHKVLEVGTTCYRAPETLFGNRAYGTSLDMWAAGVMLGECTRRPAKPLFESRDTSEDGNQLGLILSMFKTIGTPTKETWPEAIHFSTPPFEWYQEFPGLKWEEILPGVDEVSRHLVRELVKYESGQRLTAAEALKHSYFSLWDDHIIPATI